MSRGTKPALSGVVQKQTVRLVKHYDRPDFRTKHQPEDTLAKLRIEISILKMNVSALKDQRRRLRQEIEETIKMLTAALDGAEETVEQVQRRISRLKGSLEYKGRYDFGMTEL